MNPKATEEAKSSKKKVTTGRSKGSKQSSAKSGKSPARRSSKKAKKISNSRRNASSRDQSPIQNQSENRESTKRGYKFKNDYMEPSSKEFKGYWVEKSDQGDDKFYCVVCDEHFKIPTLWGEKGHGVTAKHEANELRWKEKSLLEEGKSDSKEKKLGF